MGLLGFWPWWCVWVGQDCSCPDSWCILTEKCWGGAAPATSSPAAGRSRPCPIWRWSRPYRRRHPTASPSCPLRQRSAECCRGSSWPGKHNVETKRDLLGILTGQQKQCSCIRYHRAHTDDICWNNAGKEYLQHRLLRCEPSLHPEHQLSHQYLHHKPISRNGTRLCFCITPSHLLMGFSRRVIEPRLPADSILTWPSALAVTNRLPSGENRTQLTNWLCSF